MSVLVYPFQGFRSGQLQFLFCSAQFAIYYAVKYIANFVRQAYQRNCTDIYIFNGRNIEKREAISENGLFYRIYME